MHFTFAEFPSKSPTRCGARGCSPGYGHPAHLEIAARHGTLPLLPAAFRRPAATQRLLFTCGPTATRRASWRRVRCSSTPTIARPMPATDFPMQLRALPLAFEARAAWQPRRRLSARPEVAAEEQMEATVSRAGRDWLHVRHAEAGCFIARVERRESGVRN